MNNVLIKKQKSLIIIRKSILNKPNSDTDNRLNNLFTSLSNRDKENDINYLSPQRSTKSKICGSGFSVLSPASHISDVVGYSSAFNLNGCQFNNNFNKNDNFSILESNMLCHDIMNCNNNPLSFVSQFNFNNIYNNHRENEDIFDANHFPNIGSMGNMGNIGNMSNIGNMGNIGSIGSMGNSGSLGNMGSMSNLGNIGNIMSTMNMGSMGNPIYNTIININPIVYNPTYPNNTCETPNHNSNLVIENNESFSINIPRSVTITYETKRANYLTKKYEEVDTTDNVDTMYEISTKGTSLQDSGKTQFNLENEKSEYVSVSNFNISDNVYLASNSKDV